MKKISIKKLIMITLAVFAIVFQSYAQQYTTTGIVQYQKRDGYNYKKTLMKPSVHATWSIYTDNKLVRVLEGDKAVLKIKRKTKSGGTTTYIIDLFVEEMKVIIDGKSVTTIEGANSEIKSVYKITKTEKISGPYGDNY